MSQYSAEYYEANGSDGDRIALRWYAALINRHAPAGPVLDFGCGPGWMIRRMRMSRPCDGLEVSAYSREEALRRNPGSVVFTSLSEVTSATYAAVSAIHVLEHIGPDQVGHTVSELVRMLKPGGVMLVVTPDLTGRAAALRGPQWRALSDPTHVNLRGHEDWRAELREAGLRIMAEGTDGLWDPPYGNWIRDRIMLAPIATQVLAGRLLLAPGSGESSVLVAGKL